MSQGCSFTDEHYVEIIRSAKAGGYTFRTFTKQPEPGDLFLRHDVDLSLAAAVRMAKLEQWHGIAATYFLMSQSVFYNLASPPGEQAIRQLWEHGHAVGHHAVYPAIPLESEGVHRHAALAFLRGFDPVMSWHTPEPAYMTAKVDGVLNVMQPPWFTPDCYRSDSNHNWRHGCPCGELRAGSFEWLQLLIHPETWVFPGRDMREKMLRMLDEERKRRLDELALYKVDI